MDKKALVIEDEACWGCKTCEVACKQENSMPDGVKLIQVDEDGPRTEDGKVHFLYRVNRCRHCEDAPCKEVCPEKAITAREDGIVILDSELCTGCETCLQECPYDAIAFDAKEQVARKCNLCYHRVDQGLFPACADNVCLAHCIYFDVPAEIEKILAEKMDVRSGKNA